MKKLICAAAIFGIAAMMSSCASATHSGIGLYPGINGAFSSQVKEIEPIAEYTVFLGLFSSGYDDFLQEVSGKDIDVVNTSYIIFNNIKAIPRNKK